MQSDNLTVALPEVTRSERPARVSGHARVSASELNSMTLDELFTALGMKRGNSKDLDTTLTHCVLDQITLRSRGAL